MPRLQKAFWALAALGGIYAVFLGALINPRIQRFALYANKFHTAYWDDLSDSEAFGFMRNQVRPFNITTPDGETLYAWHVLPLSVYDQYESELLQEAQDDEGQTKPYEDSFAFKLLTEDPSSQVIISFHGNAGHLGNGFRKDNYRSITSSSNVHMIAFDYRGFGLSTGTPTEEGLIIDGMAAIMFVLNALAIPPNRITILAQSLGTAVSSAVVLHLTDGAAAEELLPSYQNSEDFTPPFAVASSMDFNAVILVAPFASIPTLMKTYRVFKLIPILSPLRFYPFIEEWVSGRIGETWNTEARVTALAQAYSNMEEDRKLHLHFIHAIDDFDIPYRHSEQLMYAAANGSRASGLSRSEFEDEKEKHVITRKGGRLTWPLEGPDGSSRGEVLLDIVRFGGHNRLGTLPPVALAVKRALGEGRITEQIAME